MPDAPVLLVEDDPNDVFLVRRAFSKASIPHPLEVVTDGDAAVAYLGGAPPFEDPARFRHPFLILLDLKLPKRSGLEVLEWLRGQAVLKRIPVVVLTSSAQAPDVNQAYELGANSYLVKPVEFAELLEMMRTVQRYWGGLNMRPEISLRAGGRVP